ncbi:aminopeptidase P family N-terminal domain-containing protein, partial [Paraburkholderia lycopersici]
MPAATEKNEGAPRLVFARSEYDARIARTRSAMQKAGVELLIVTDPTNMNWLTGY